MEILFLQQWNDFQLKWNKSDYGDIEKIRIPIDRLWKPDITLYTK